MYRELGAELKIDDELIMGPVESFKQLLAEQPTWIRDLVKYVQFAPDKPKGKNGSNYRGHAQRS